jgi:hypothetical protein
MLGGYIASQKPTRNCKTVVVKRGRQTASEDTWAAKWVERSDGTICAQPEADPLDSHFPIGWIWLPGSFLPATVERRSISRSHHSLTSAHHTAHESKIFYASSGHGLTWPVSSSSCSCHFSCTLHERAWSWHFLRLWSRSSIPFDIASISSPVSPKSPSVHSVHLLSPLFHVHSTSAAHCQPCIASSHHPRLASTLDLFHQDSISIPFRSLLQDLPHRLQGETGRLDQALTFSNSQLRPTHLSRTILLTAHSIQPARHHRYPPTYLLPTCLLRTAICRRLMSPLTRLWTPNHLVAKANFQMSTIYPTKLSPSPQTMSCTMSQALGQMKMKMPMVLMMAITTPRHLPQEPASTLVTAASPPMARRCPASARLRSQM